MIQGCQPPTSSNNKIIENSKGRNDRWRHIARHDVTWAKNARWFWSTYIAPKQFIFSHSIAYITVEYQKLWGNVMLMVTQTRQNIWHFMVVKSSPQEIATLAIIREISDSNLETVRYGPKSGVSQIIQESWQRRWSQRCLNFLVILECISLNYVEYEYDHYYSLTIFQWF